MIIYALSPIISVNRIFPRSYFVLSVDNFFFYNTGLGKISDISVKWCLNRWKKTNHTHNRRLTCTKDVTLESLKDLAHHLHAKFYQDQKIVTNIPRDMMQFFYYLLTSVL